MDRFAGDLRYAARSLRRAPRFTVTAVLVLALGIGAATAVFTAFRSVVLDDLPMTDPDRLVLVSAEGQDGGSISLTLEEVERLRRESRTLLELTGVAAFGAEAVPLTEGQRSLVLSMSRVMPDFFQVLGSRPVLGRLLRPEDGHENAPLVTVISHGTWQREFGADPEVLGRRLTQTTYQDSYSIVGVAPPGLDFPVGADYWVPAPAGNAVDVVARLAADASPEAAGEEFLSLVRALDQRGSEPLSLRTVTVEALSEVVLGDARPVLVAIAAAVALLLLIACVNVGNLLLMWMTQRSRDLMVRRALGATSGAVARQLLMEGVLLGAAGGALGLALAAGLLGVLPSLAPDRLPRAEVIGLGGVPVAVAIAITLLAVLLFAVAPAVAAARWDLAALRTHGRLGSGTVRRRRVRRSLVIVQVALAVVLLMGAGLLVRSLQNLTRLDLGYEAGRVAIVELGFNRERRESPQETFALLEGVLERVRALQGVTAATPVMSRPFMGATGVFRTQPMLEGQSPSDVESTPRVPLEVGDHELFRSLGIPILRGRGFLETDREGAPRVVVVSQAVAERLWPGQEPVGQQIRMVTGREQTWTVVGVSGDTRFRRHLEPTPTIYVPVRQLQILPAVWTVAMRTRDDDLVNLLPAMRSAVADFDSRINVWRAEMMSDYLTRGPLARPRMSALLLSGFGLAALLLAAIGLYGVMSLAVRERTHELGIRKALGASATRLHRAVLGEALTTTIAGIGLGLVAALLMTRLLGAMLFGTTPADPVTLAGVAGLLLLIAVVAAYLPARRATRVDPMDALRGE